MPWSLRLGVRSASMTREQLVDEGTEDVPVDRSAAGGIQKHTTDPKAGRLVLFKARTVMHEVLPTHRKRFALTLWYFSGREPQISLKLQ